MFWIYDFMLMLFDDPEIDEYMIRFHRHSSD